MSEWESGNKGIRPSILPLSSGKPMFSWWLYTIVVLGSLLLATGALVAVFHPALLVPPQDAINEAVHIYGGYFAARNFGLAVMLLTAMILRSRGMLNSLMLLTALIQVLDAVMDCVEGRWPLVPGVVVFAVIFFAGSARLSGYPFWRIEAWKQG
jgi:hypothetical protein